MNTYEYIMERKRMCDSFGYKCKGCPANFDGMFCCGLAAMSTLNAKEQVAIVEKWSAEHPKKQRKTRQAALDKLSEDNKQESNPVPQQTEKQANPFGNLRPAEIPTRLHTFSYQGCEKKKKIQEAKGE